MPTGRGHPRLRGRWWRLADRRGGRAPVSPASCTSAGSRRRQGLAASLRHWLLRWGTGGGGGGPVSFFGRRWTCSPLFVVCAHGQPAVRRDHLQLAAGLALATSGWAAAGGGAPSLCWGSMLRCLACGCQLACLAAAVGVGGAPGHRCRGDGRARPCSAACHSGGRGGDDRPPHTLS